MAAAKLMESLVVSSDGTRIGFDRVGSGPAVVLVEPALHYRDFSAFTGLMPLLSQEFTVVSYDRRGRGASTDSKPYSPDREVDDLDALISANGGTADLYGYSTGALLALHAAARRLPIGRLALLEPPLREDDAETPDPLTIALGELVSAGRYGDAVEHFHRSIGVPEEFVTGMRTTPAWEKMESVAHTLVYDCLISEATTSSLLRSIAVPTLVLDSEGSTENLTGWAARVASQLSRGSHRSLPGEWHGVSDKLLAPALIDFFRREGAVIEPKDQRLRQSVAPRGRRTAPDTPLSSTGPTSANVTGTPTAASTTAWLTRTSQGLASSAILAATFTVRPK